MENDNMPTSSSNANGSADDAEAFSLLMSYPEESDYYDLLGLPRDPPPTDSAIRSAYRTLTLSFHPDKQPPELQDAAKQQFERISEAYETLIHPQKRIVYDLLGAEGVRKEWGTGGAMGRGGEAEKQQRREQGQGQVGVKAMKPEDFKRWFFETMKKRERGVVNSLVRSKGSLIVGIDAKKSISFRDVVPDIGEDDEEEDYAQELVFQAPKISDFAVRYSFVTPFPTLRTIFGEDEKDDEESEKAEDEVKEENETPDLEIYAGVSGKIQRFFNEVELEYEDGETEMRKVPLPLVLSTQALNLGFSSSRVFHDSNPKGILNRWPYSFLQNTLLSVDAAVLPATTLQANLAKSIVLAPGTRPFNVVLGTSFGHSVFQVPPTLSLQVTKGIGDDKTAFCNWSSGFLQWPSVLQTLLAPFAGEDIIFEDDQGVSQLQLGIMSRGTRLASGLADEDEDPSEPNDEEDEEYEALRAKQRNERSADEAWQFAISSSPATNALVFKYSRNIFSGSAPTDVALSQWSSEKHYELPPANKPRSVRLEIASTVNDSLNFSWSVHGSRQVSELTRVGCGVGIQARGLVMTISWARLGQAIKIPVAVCPAEAVDPDTATLAVLLPWLAYCAFEFGFIRPRERRNRRKVIARQQKRLKKLVPQKRVESAQAIELMADQVQRRQDKEYKQGGLVITKAEYGHYPKADKDKEPEVTDVTVPVAALVDHGQLNISKNTVKFHILGFHDPAPLKPKTLKIWYQYHGKEHYVQANDGEGIACPMRSHSTAA